jgi:hypothetical protein
MDDYTPSSKKRAMISLRKAMSDIANVTVNKSPVTLVASSGGAQVLGFLQVA